MRRSIPEPLLCSFCHKSQDSVAKLISNPSDYPRAYICDVCVHVCASILEDAGVPAPAELPVRPSHSLIRHPSVALLLENVEAWVQAEEQGRNPAQFVENVLTMARRMMGLEAR